jgi:hypothetical protein
MSEIQWKLHEPRIYCSGSLASLLLPKDSSICRCEKLNLDFPAAIWATKYLGEE